MAGIVLTSEDKLKLLQEAVKKLVESKGRYHSELNYKSLEEVYKKVT